LWGNVKMCGGQIYDAMQERTIYSIVLLMFLYSLFMPSFDGFQYFFYLDVIGLDKFTFAALRVLE
jgi:hypothetical protein